MFCPTCGKALTLQTKYCNRCGAQLSSKDPDAIKLFEERMDSEMEGLFWSTVLGLGLILGGLALLKKVEIGDWYILAYMILSSAAFITYFGLGLWQVRRVARMSKEAKGDIELAQRDTTELDPARSAVPLNAAPSVTEHTTRTLEPIPRTSRSDRSAEGEI